MRLSSMPQLGEHFEHLPLEGMVRAGDADLAGEVSEVGSVSWVSYAGYDIMGSLDFDWG